MTLTTWYLQRRLANAERRREREEVLTERHQLNLLAQMVAYTMNDNNYDT